MLGLAAALRLSWPDAGWFGADQARDLTWGTRIASGEAFPDVGPAMRNRIYLGAFYYYFWAIPFLFSADPTSAYLFAGLLGVLATALTFELGRLVAGPSAGIASALVFATTPLAVIDGRVAWAPAAIPALSAGLLVAVVRLLQSASRTSAIAAAALAAFLVQLHLAAAPAVAVAGVAILSRARRLGAAGVVASVAAGLAVLAPTLWALTVAAPGASGAAAPDPTVGRLGDLLLVGANAFSGLGPEPAVWPAWVRGLVGLEAAWGALVLVCLVVVGLRPATFSDGGGVAAVVGTLAASVVAVWLLPWEAWHYYLDLALVPASVVVGLALAGAPGRVGWWLLAGLAAGRTALVLWWLISSQVQGVTYANLDLLRLGGQSGVDPAARARIPTVATRAEAAGVLVTGLGFTPSSLWQRAHGPAFSDLDTDNGYFFARARPGDTSAAGEVVVVYRGQVPESWRSAQPAPIVAGPLEILQYDPWLPRSQGRLLGCGGGSIPARPGGSPLSYGAGELPRAAWPCAEPVVEIPVVRAGDRAVVVRVFARVDGAGHVVDLQAMPVGSARVIDNPPPGLGRGIELTRAATHVRVRLAVDGPASLDLFELRGE